MFKRLSFVAFVFLFLLVAPIQAQTLDEVITKHISATGGIEKWKALESLKVISRSEHFSFNQYWKKPNRIRVEVLLGPPTEGRDVRVYDGAIGWRINPMEGSEDPRLMSAKETSDLQEEGDWLKELIDYKAKGHKVELVGKEVMEGSSVYKLKLTKPGGEVIQIYLDEKTFLEVKRVRRKRAPWGEDVEVATELGNYRLVGGLMLPHSVGNAVREYEINKPIDDAIFKMPQKKAEGRNAGKDGEKKANNLTDQVSDPERRAQFLKNNPEADLDKDGLLTLEEAWAFAKKGKAAEQLLTVGAPAPDWTLKDANGKSHNLSDYRGKVVVMDFFAVWCIPCHRAMPGLQRLHEDLSKRGLVVIGISTSEHGGDPAQLMKDRGYTYGLLLNGETIAKDYRVVGLPTIYVIGIDGRVIYSGFGANDIAEHRRRVFIEDYLTRQGK